MLAGKVVDVRWRPEGGGMLWVCWWIEDVGGDDLGLVDGENNVGRCWAVVERIY